MSVAEWADTYGIHHWWILWSSYRKLAWVGFELTTTKFRSDALTDWAIRPWVQLTLRGHFVQLLQFQCHISFWLFVFFAAVFFNKCFCNNYLFIFFKNYLYFSCIWCFYVYRLLSTCIFWIKIQIKKRLLCLWYVVFILN